jgi:hypothetical protein
MAIKFRLLSTPGGNVSKGEKFGEDGDEINPQNSARL